MTDDMTKQKPSVYQIPAELYERLLVLGMLPNEVRKGNVGASDYAEHLIQPWAIWLDYKLNPWDADIVKRVLRTKAGESRTTAYKKIIHICQERIRQLEYNTTAKTTMTKEERQQILKRLEREAIDDAWNFLQDVGEGIKHPEGIRTDEQWPVTGIDDTDEE